MINSQLKWFEQREKEKKKNSGSICFCMKATIPGTHGIICMALLLMSHQVEKCKPVILQSLVPLAGQRAANCDDKVWTHQVKVHWQRSESCNEKNKHYNSVFHQCRQAKFANGSSILSSSQFSILPQLPQKMKLASKVVKLTQK